MWSVGAPDPNSALNANYNIGDEDAGMYHTPGGNFNSNVITNNVIINEGNGGGPAAYNVQLGCNAGTCDNSVIADNYLDWSGGYYAWFALYRTITFTRVGGNMGLVSGRACDPSNWTIAGGGKRTGTCK